MSHLDIQIFLVKIALLLLVSRGLGLAFLRIGQPSVIGEILAGVILGPSCIGVIFPDLFSSVPFFSPIQETLADAVGLIGILFLLFVTGLEIDLLLIKRQLRQAFGVALGGLMVPLIIGYAVGELLPESLLVNPDQRKITAIFLAIAFAISAIPVIARVLMELGLMRRNVAQTLLAAAMIDDATGWILLSTVVALASGGVVSLATAGYSFLTVIGFTLVSVTVGKWAVLKFINFLFYRGASQDTLPFVCALIFFWAAISQGLHLEAMFGAFVLGIIFSLTPRLNGDVIHTIEQITNQIAAPLFFGLAGLKMNLQAFTDPVLLLTAVLIIVLAIAAKLAGVYFGARWIGKTDKWSALFYAGGLTARGSMGIVVATIGLSLGIISPNLFSIIILMAIFTSLLSPPALRYAIGKIELSPEESARLQREELDKDTFLASVQRVLIPLRYRSGPAFHNFLPHELDVYTRLNSKRNLSVSLLTVVNPGEELGGQGFLESLAPLLPNSQPQRRAVSGDDTATLIVDEANKGYDLMILGTSREKESSSRAVFSPLVDYVIRMSACPVILVHGELPPMRPQGLRVLVPTNGSIASRRAAEISFRLMDKESSELFFLKVVESGEEHSSDIRLRRQLVFGHQIVRELKVFARAHGITASGEVRVGPDPESVILESIVRNDIDLLVLGTRVRLGGERLYLGPRVEKLLHEAPCPVIVLNI